MQHFGTLQKEDIEKMLNEASKNEIKQVFDLREKIIKANMIIILKKKSMKFPKSMEQFLA